MKSERIKKDMLATCIHKIGFKANALNRTNQCIYKGKRYKHQVPNHES